MACSVIPAPVSLFLFELVVVVAAAIVAVAEFALTAFAAAAWALLLACAGESGDSIAPAENAAGAPGLALALGDPA